MKRERRVSRPGTAAAGPEAGFTLIEAMAAIIVLVFGLIAVTNLLVVAASTNSVANQSSAATAVATEVMDNLKSTSWDSLPVGGAVAVTPPPVSGGTKLCTAAAATDYFCYQDVPGVGRVVAQWSIAPIVGTGRAIFIRVRTEGAGALAGVRSRAEFTTIRSCTDTVGAGCPLAP